jgi:alkylated DNA repair dioxygenase AlkB
MNRQQTDFFSTPSLPLGMTYVENFVSAADEESLLMVVAQLPLQHSRYKQYTANRRTLSYGATYDFSSNQLTAAPPIEPFLHPQRSQVADFIGMSADRFEQALITEYRPGTALGWHRDVPQFEIVVGISLASACRMRLRPYPPPANKRQGVIAIELRPRSMYVLRDEARWNWQHSIPATKTLRYSITFRTRNSASGRPRSERA